MAQRAMLCGPRHSGMYTHRSSVQRSHPSYTGAQTLQPLLRYTHQDPYVHPHCNIPNQLQPACPRVSPEVGPTPFSTCAYHSLTHVHSESRGQGPQPWLYLEEARCHGACCHGIVGGYAPHHRAGGSCSALQDGGDMRLGQASSAPVFPQQ